MDVPVRSPVIPYRERVPGPNDAVTKTIVPVSVSMLVVMPVVERTTMVFIYYLISSRRSEPLRASVRLLDRNRASVVSGDFFLVNGSVPTDLGRRHEPCLGDVIGFFQCPAVPCSLFYLRLGAIVLLDGSPHIFQILYHSAGLL